MIRIWLSCAMVAVFSLVQTKATECCPPGQVVIEKEEFQDYCWEPDSNTTSSLSLTCNQTGFLRNSETLGLRVNSAGQLIMSLPNLETEFEPDQFCLANFTTIKDKHLKRTTSGAVLCYEEEVRTIPEEALSYMMIISSIMLLITTLIYIALPELRDLQGKSIINFCLSLGIGLCLLAVIQIAPYSDMDLCAARGFFVYFFIIASFFWMNAISIQILFSIRRPTVLNYGWKEFTYYAIYAWGCPTVLTTIMAVINFMPGAHLKPGIGLNHCWFFNKKQQWYYMYSVMSILIGVNILIFLYISIHLWRQSFASSQVKALRYKFTMSLRMFVIMGLSFTAEMIGSLHSHFIWEICDILNCLQGVLIFLVVVVFRKRVIKAMHRHGWLDCVTGPVERHLALGEDDEDVVQHTVGVSLDDTKNHKIYGPDT